MSARRSWRWRSAPLGRSRGSATSRCASSRRSTRCCSRWSAGLLSKASPMWRWRRPGCAGGQSFMPCARPSSWRCCARWGCCAAASSPRPRSPRSREVCRYRKKLTQARTSELQRLCKVLEDGGVKIDSVASSITTVSARAMVEALVAGERDPRVLADLARGVLRKKLPDLAMALAGRFDAHHALLARMHLEHIDHLAGMIGRLDTQIEQMVAPFAEQVRALCTIPGIGERTAQVLIGELGVDMSRFASADQLASWAGVCPANNEW